MDPSLADGIVIQRQNYIPASVLRVLEERHVRPHNQTSSLVHLLLLLQLQDTADLGHE